MPNSMQDQFLIEQVDLLYKRTRVSVPTAKNCIAPLAEIIGSFSLSLVELPHLTGATIVRHLNKRQIAVSDALEEVQTEGLAGFLYATRHNGLIFVEQNDPLFRRRYSAAHELGHYWLHILPQMAALPTGAELHSVSFIDGAKEKYDDDQEPDFTSVEQEVAKLKVRSDLQLPPPAQMEREAERFAANLLMPTAIVEGLVAKYKIGFQGRDLVQRLAAEMLVSRRAMYYRLHNLGLWTANKLAKAKEVTGGTGLS